MQSKIYKKSTLFLTLVVLIDIASIVGLIVTRNVWAAKKVETIIAFVALVFILSTVYSYYDLNADRNIIKNAVKNGDVAMAKIIDGKFVRFGRDAKLKNHVYWELTVEIYDNDMQKIPTKIVEKFSTHQTSIPKGGYVFVTYIEGKPEDSLIIPNVIISSIPEYSVLVEDYEKAIRPKYLNAYYNNGLIVQTYKESMAAEKKIREFDEKFK